MLAMYAGFLGSIVTRARSFEELVPGRLISKYLLA